MSKDTFFTGQPIFTQLLQLIPKHLIRDVVRKHQSDRYYKHFKTYEHLVTMLYATFHGCKSLREVTTGMMACLKRLLHVGILHLPRRSTLAEANARRTEKVFDDLYHSLYAHFYPDSRRLTTLEERLFIFDSTTIELFSEVIQGVGKKPVNGRRKGGIKAHVLTKADEDVPRFVWLTPARQNDNILTHMLDLPEHAIVTFDRGYQGYKPLIKWGKKGITWVTRLHQRLTYQILSDQEISDQQRQMGIRADTLILLGYSKRKLRIDARKITYKDPESGKELIFITNNMGMKPTTIAYIYKQRWQIECLFKRLKQNYPLKYFLGDNANAIKIQIWCALISDLLIKIVKDRVKKKWSFSNIASIIRLHLMTYIHLTRFLQNPEKSLINYPPANHFIQPSLFDP